MSIWLLGSGGHARVIADLGVELAGVLDDSPERWGAPFRSVTIMGPINDSLVQSLGVFNTVIAIGDNRLRLDLAKRVRLYSSAALVAPFSWVSADAGLGNGTVVISGSVVNSGAMVGEHVILNTRCSVDHDCEIANFVHVAPGATLCGGVQVGEGTLIGAGATILPGVKVGSWAVVGAGAVVVSDVDDGAIVTGVPAR
jgi:acetyltransferase EpsM